MGLGRKRTFSTSEKPRRSNPSEIAISRSTLHCDAANRRGETACVDFDGSAPPERPPFAKYLPLPASGSMTPVHSLNDPNKRLATA
jgi:hypothetical protein